MREVEKPLILSIVGNILLGLIKIIIGYVYSSISLISDGIHSLSDVITSIIAIIGVKIASKPADDAHPYGHSRFECLFSFFIGLALFFTAYEIGKFAVERIIYGEVIEVNAIMVVVAILSIVVKELMTRYSLFIGKKLNSQVLIADAYHHRSDALSSVVVLAGLLLQKFGIYYGDAIAGIIVAFMIAKVAFDICLTNMHYLTGRAPSENFFEVIKKEALNVDKVIGVHDIKAHYVGPKIHVELHVEVPSNISAKEMHDIEVAVKNRLESLDNVEKAYVHVDIVD
ncbi:cation diffusion facilitator family transporter [Methanocaldococcus bathoardescens]|uniref:Cation diffusion facilitator family transporter n=1 Tax=Methanocaldococcus bathoardescens TaxID=1301915 RepID=A0A076LI77_9EURY|nr:cation diffusion facilitator family transporter [Methanocaldococcus bathoardescens]AIJ06203.1 cation diffusion facilitator family transporter [Methanocaldococcus bathoardescens]